jgi:RND family efflux transporter MFP subunit
MKLSTTKLLVAGLVVAILGAAGAWTIATQAQNARGAEKKSAAPARPALSVTVTMPQPEEWPQLLAANGNIAPWQEAVIGAEIGGHRLTEVLVNVGDQVKKGQVLARILSDTIAAEVAQSKAALAEAEATLAEARANADRARQIQHTGAFSDQQIAQFLTAEQTARARVTAARARVHAEDLRLAQTRVVAPDDGVISARTATVGSTPQPGQELFRLIRGGRLEWRAEVIASELPRIKPGMSVSIMPPGASDPRLSGTVRMVAPTVDAQTRNAIVYVDLPAGSGARAGMFARGEFELGKVTALTLPMSAVVMREGFSYVYRIEQDNRVSQVKVSTGRRVGERIEITGGLDPNARVAASGGGFLADGDTVRVVGSPAAKVTSK